MAKKESQATWQNRIVGYETHPASWFRANPANWRIHSKAQQDALGGVLDSVGVVQNVIVNQRTGNMIDGHLRVTLALRKGDETPLPVTVVDLTEAEEAMILATLDPLGAMAATDRQKLDELMRQVQSDDERVQTMLEELAVKQGLIDPPQPNYEELWQGMPEFEQEDAGALKTIKVHFATQADIIAFSELIDQTITDKTISIWHPKKERADILNARCQDES